jgi:hypothetical protein
VADRSIHGAFPGTPERCALESSKFSPSIKEFSQKIPKLSTFYNHNISR